MTIPRTTSNRNSPHPALDPLPPDRCGTVPAGCPAEIWSTASFASFSPTPNRSR